MAEGIRLAGAEPPGAAPSGAPGSPSAKFRTDPLLGKVYIATTSREGEW